MTHGVLLVLPPDPPTDCAKTTLEAIIDHLQKPIICYAQLKSTREITALDLDELETTSERIQGNTIFEYYENPLAGKVSTATSLAQGSQLDRIGLVLDRWPPPGLVIDSLSQCFSCAGNLWFVPCHFVRWRLHALNCLE